ncbi:MAG: type II toxin-antitoxin system RelE/ParE family toxin [Mailhella sp.]|nr:type II toxin-antitoxin system RelE/ParE family toxin [Mailhella sp.]
MPQPTDILPGYWKFKVGRHVIYFKEHDDYLDVIRILHVRMDVENHLPV